MWYSRDWALEPPLNKFILSLNLYYFWLVICALLIMGVSAALALCFDDNAVSLYLKENIWLCAFVGSLLLPSFALGAMYLVDYVKKWRLTDEEALVLSRYHFSKLTRKQKKLMARSIGLSPALVFMRLKSMTMTEAIKDFKQADFNLAEQTPKNVNILLKSIPSMKHTDKGITHTLSEWEMLFAEERIKNLKGKIRTERHRIHKYRGKSNDAQQADLLNISYLDYKRYTTFYNGIIKATEQFGLNSKEAKTAMQFAIDRVGDLQEWFDFVSSKEHLPVTDVSDKGRYATYFTNIISNASDNVNVFYTRGSFYVMAYFDNITYEESNTFKHDNVTLYLYQYEFAYFLVLEFERLRFATPLNIRDAQVDVERWLGTEENEIRVNLMEKNDGRLVASRILQIKRMNAIKERMKIQGTFDKIVIDAGISKAINKSLDEMVYNGFILEVVKGDRNAKEEYLRF